VKPAKKLLVPVRLTSVLKALALLHLTLSNAPSVSACRGRKLSA
jgi:hypothetical protein